MSGKQAMYTLARKLRAKAEWDYVDGWYSTEADQARNSAKREFASDLAELIDEAFDFDTSLRGQDYSNHRKYPPKFEVGRPE